MASEMREISFKYHGTREEN